MKSLCMLVVAGLSLSLPVALKGEEKPAVHLAGLRVVGPGYGLNGTELQAFHEQSGTTLALAVLAPGNRKIVEVDDSRCSLAEFTDDKGQNLLDGIRWGGFPKTSEDGGSALIEVSSKARPSRDASRLHARGVIRLRVAASERTETVKNLRLAVGAKANVLQESIQVLKVEEENDGLTLVLQINRILVDNMKDIRFFAANGKAINIWSRGSFTFGKVSQTEYNLETSSAAGPLKIEMDLWQDLEALDITFEIDAGVGLSR